MACDGKYSHLKGLWKRCQIYGRADAAFCMAMTGAQQGVCANNPAVVNAGSPGRASTPGPPRIEWMGKLFPEQPDRRQGEACLGSFHSNLRSSVFTSLP